MIETRNYRLKLRRNPETLAMALHDNERTVRRTLGRDVLSLHYCEKRLETSPKEPNELFYVEGVVLQVSYDKTGVPVSVTGTPEGIDGALPTLIKLVGDELIEIRRSIRY